MAAAWETAGYAFRIVSVTKQMNSEVATAQQLLILLAPLWINAFAYMVLGRMIHFFLTPDKVMGIRARSVTKMFVWFDIFSFIVQLIGGLMTNSTNPVKTQKLGIHIYMGGVGLQLFFILIFIVLAVSFHRAINRSMTPNESDDSKPLTPGGYSSLSRFDYSHYSSSLTPKTPTSALHLLCILYLVLGLIIFRNMYRLIEFSMGVNSTITHHEWYAYVFDAVPMLCALVAFNIYHPGKVLRGPRSGFSEENKMLKQQKKDTKAAKKQAKLDKKEMKKMGKEGLRLEVPIEGMSKDERMPRSADLA